MSNIESAEPTFAPYQISEGEEYMSDEQLEHFRQLLLQWKKNLMAEVDRTVHHMQDDASNFPDPNDRATQFFRRKPNAPNDWPEPFPSIVLSNHTSRRPNYRSRPRRLFQADRTLNSHDGTTTRWMY